MKRRDFLKATPLALAGVALPAEACLTEPPLLGGAMILPEKWGEPSDSHSVIRVEMTPAGPLPVMEMMGPYLTNPDVFFGEMEWTRIVDTGVLTSFYVKETKGFLKKENASFHKTDAGCFWVCCGAVALKLIRFDGQTGSSIDLNIRAIPESTLYRVDGSAVRV